MLTSDFDYSLPEELIAQYPAEKRQNSRMLVMKRESGECEIKDFSAITEYLSPGDCVVFNNTKVMKARIYGRKESAAGAMIEGLLITEQTPGSGLWKAMLRPGKRARRGTKVFLTVNSVPSGTFFEVLDKNDDGTFLIRFSNPDINRVRNEFGHIPLPPYIKREDESEDFERYQTVYAKTPGAVAAPTAGLHFDKTILEKVKEKNILSAEITLHVGPGTFKPVSEENPLNHKMHSEEFIITEKAASTINSARKTGGKILAVGTTSVRALESSCDKNGQITPGRNMTEIFIHPPYRPRAVDMLLTNFHLPKSTLLMLVCAFAEREKVLDAYQLAIKEKFRFYSYGDCMLLI
jgi:S-adenosylmethionine:tRNA ribosyltransferase-isomerase